MKKLSYYILLLASLLACDKDDGSPIEHGLLQLTAVRVGTVDLDVSQTIDQVPFDKGIVLSFSLPLNKESAENAISLQDNEGNPVALSFAYLDQDKTISATPNDNLQPNTGYLLSIDQVISATGEIFSGVEYSFTTEEGSFEISSASINGKNLLTSTRIQNIPTTIDIDLTFSEPLSESTDLSEFISIGNLDLSFQTSEEGKTLNISATESDYLKKYALDISPLLKSQQNIAFAGFSKDFYTQLDSTFKFPEISEEELLTKIQEQTFKYFYDFGHPASGLARERNSSGNTVTIGGSGFGVMAILVGIERGFITRQEGIDRLQKIVDFLEDADRFHGVWPHWMDGNTGQTIPFSADDDGADLVETAFMIQGLLTVRAYLTDADAQELAIKNKITVLWEAVEWDWFTQGGQDVLYWHWSPNFDWQKNHKIQGWNEALIIYVLAAASPTHSIEASVYDQGWARNGNIINGNDFYDITLPLGSDRGGPLFFSHYSFLGLDPRNLEDAYANYWTQNTSHSQINRAYCISNPMNYVGYASTAWGLTASDNHEGYSAHSPNNDKGVITPTAAIASMPYTPAESMEAIRHFYYLMGDKLWGTYGFYDAYNVTENWYASSYLAIDQGPIIVMIENHRTALLWDLFMSDGEITEGLDKLGFTSY